MNSTPSTGPGRMANNKKIRIIIGIVSLAILGLVFYGYQSQKAGVTQRSSDIKPVVDILQLERRDMTRKIELTGKTVPESQVDISAKYSGKITQINVTLGQKVEPGQILLVQDTDDIDAALAQNEATLRGADADAVESNASFQSSYEKAKADYQLSLTNYQRYKTLYETGAVSKQALDNAEQTVVAAKAAVDIWANQLMAGSSASVMSKQAARDKAQGGIYALQNQRDDMIMRAPRAGIIGFRQAEVGNFAQAGQKLLSIVDNSKIYVDCPVSEQDVGQIVPGMAAKVAIESLGKTYNGKITYISPAMDAATQSFTVRLALEDIDDTLKAGMFARTDISILLRPKTIFVPKEAVVSVNGRDRVLIIDDNNQVVERNVQIGLRNDKYVEILKGVNEGERIAVSNLARLKAGTVVNPSVVSK
ncbi:MAG: efflux RND transporter periplasmic adaptor subunit [Negativicutes bacterium]|nr:efflux RND transporter periplasmic adaptor subunit [Negativicutes bacterium]